MNERTLEISSGFASLQASLRSLVTCCCTPIRDAPAWREQGMEQVDCW